MQRLIALASLATLLAVAGFVAAPPANAGEFIDASVTIDDVARQAGGTTATARYSANPFEKIRCYTGANKGGFDYGYCEARTASGTFRVCWSYDDTLIDEMRSIPSYAHIQFHWNTSNECTFISVNRGSTALP